MSSEVIRKTIPYSEVDRIRAGREILRAASVALDATSERLESGFSDAVLLLAECKGQVIVCGVGKAGRIGRKLAATLSSTGTRAGFLHPVEALHGDIGCIAETDVALLLSNSGESAEVTAVLPLLSERGIPIVAITSIATSTLGRAADVVVATGSHREAGGEGLAPTTSTTVMMAVGDALALVASRDRQFTRTEFARCHPAGILGRQLVSVVDVMRTADQLRVADGRSSVREVLATAARPGRRTGAVLVVDRAGVLVGIFTDSDLARLLEQRQDRQLDRPISEVMTVDGLRVDRDESLGQALELLTRHKISELPVVDPDGKPIGLIDITDVIGMVPSDAAAG
jgi:arabinose-5-phosphate isomerase